MRAPCSYCTKVKALQPRTWVDRCGMCGFEMQNGKFLPLPVEAATAEVCQRPRCGSEADPVGLFDYLMDPNAAPGSEFRLVGRVRFRCGSCALEFSKDFND